METPEKLKDLDLDAFAEELHRQVRNGQGLSGEWAEFEWGMGGV